MLPYGNRYFLCCQCSFCSTLYLHDKRIFGKKMADIFALCAQNVGKTSKVRAENVGICAKVRAENVGNCTKVRAENVENACFVVKNE